MPRRVAITIAGAVSLGAYEAGVMYELLEAFSFHNSGYPEKDGAPTEPNVDKIYIDVITGASAGGMTAAMLAETLMFRGAELRSAQDNPFYNAWVKRISLKGLVHLDSSEGKWNSLLSSDLITEIGDEMLVDPMKVPPTGPHNTLEPGAPLRIGLALTNLNGVDYMIPIVGSDEGGFNYTRSVDQRLFMVHPDNTAGLDIRTPDGKTISAKWEDLRDAAVACGAFPFAFRPQDIQRDEKEYINSVTPLWPGSPDKADAGTTYITLKEDSNKEAPKKPAWDFAYTDGGVLQNQPLGIAKDLVDHGVKQRLEVAKARAHVAHNHGAAEAVENEIGHIHRDADNRIYVFVSPNEVKSSANDAFARDINIEKMLPDIVEVYLRQAQFHDWIMAETVNQKIRILDIRAHQLAKELRENRITNIPGLLQAADNLNDLLFRENEEKKQEAYDRLKHQYNVEVNGFNDSPNKDLLVDAFVAGIAALEAAAHLGDRDKMHIIAVLADGKRELAGSGIASFVGFFNEAYREHDYRVGRTKARIYLERDDVSRLLGLDVKKLQNFYKEPGNEIPSMDPPVVVPVKLDRALKSGEPWLLYAIWIRIWWLLIALAVIIYLVLAHHFALWPFR